MSERQESTTQLQGFLDRIRAGESAAGDALIQHACERLRGLSRKMVNAVVRLHRALPNVHLETVRGFFQLAAKLIRQELIDLGRHYLGPQGLGANHATDADLTVTIKDIQTFTRFHELVEGLAVEEREVVDLLFYQGMTMDEAAGALGVSDRTVKRPWRAARLALYQQFHSDWPFA